jgi:RNA polymerase sigma factor (sigma-70 family)
MCDHEMAFYSTLAKSEKALFHLAKRYSTNSAYTIDELYQEGLIRLYDLAGRYSDKDYLPELFVRSIHNRFKTMLRLSPNKKWKSIEYDAHEEMLGDNYGCSYPSPEVIHELDVQEQEIVDFLDDLREQLDPRDILVLEDLIQGEVTNKERYQRVPSKVTNSSIAAKRNVKYCHVRWSVHKIRKVARNVIKRYQRQGRSIFQDVQLTV